MQSAINQTVSLSGDADVRARLTAVGEAGEKAARRLSQAGGGASAVLGALSAAVNNLASRLGAAGNAATPVLNGIARLSSSGAALGLLGEIITTLTTGIGGIATAVVGAVAGLAALSVSSAQATVAAEAQARALGTTVEKLEGLKYAAASVGVSSEAVVTGLTRFEAALGRAREANEKAQIAAETSGASVRGMGGAYSQAAQQIEAASVAFGHSQQSVVGADQSVATLTQRLDQLKLAYRDSQNSAQTNARLQQQIEAGTAAVTAAEQRRQQAIEASRQAFERLQKTQADAAGAQRAAALKAGEDSGQNILGAIAALSSGASADSVRQLGQFADRFNAIKDSAEQAALGMSVLGREWREFVPLLEIGSVGLANLSTEMNKLHEAVKPTGTELETAKSMNSAFAAVTLVIDGLKNAVGNIFGQYFAPMFKGIAEGLADNATGIRDVAQGFAGTLIPAVQAFGAAVKIVFDDVRAIFIVASIGAKALGLDWSASSIAGVTAAVALVAAIGRITGAFRLLNLVMAANPIVLVTGFIVALSAAFYLLFGDTQKLSDLIRKVFGDDAANSFDSFVKNFRASFEALGQWFDTTWLGRLTNGFMRWLHGAIDAVGNFVKAFRAGYEALQQWFATSWVGGMVAGIGKVLAEMKKLLDMLHLHPSGTGDAGTAAAGAAAPGHAAGGMIRGPGTGTSDSILARLSNGEFVARAAAVQHYGASLFHALNNLQLPRFELGGLVDSFSEMLAPQRAFAAGGFVGSSPMGGADSRETPVHLHLGGRIFELHGPKRTADDLVEYARGEQLRSAGRRPSRDSGTTNG